MNSLFSLAESIQLFAYLDPASGGVLLQVIGAAVVSVGMFFKYYGTAVFKFFGYGRKQQSVDESLEPSTDKETTDEIETRRAA